jgi:hypothetical protein
MKKVAQQLSLIIATKTWWTQTQTEALAYIHFHVYQNYIIYVTFVT